ncbi:DNA polymerase delta subunit 3 [Mactra antiquata]
MAVDELYLENIDEYVKDERKLVTYKWLSLTLQVHCNIAKLMLYKYIDVERNTKETDGLYVTYFVSGLSKPDESGTKIFKCSIVPEEKLDGYKSSLDVLTSCHIYSVQMTKLKDSNTLYLTDYEKFKECVFDANKYSSIQCKKAEPRSEEDMQLLSMAYINTSEPEKKVSVTSGNTATKPASKKQPQSALQSMFSKADANKKIKKEVTEDKQVEKPVTEKQVDKDTGKTSKKAGGMMAFFSKETDKKSVKQTDKVTPKISPKISPKKTTMSSPVKEEMTSKKKAREEDSDDEIINRSKRRRTGQDLFDSDSEEDMEAEDEEPIPPSPPPKQASPVIVDSPEKVEEIEDPIPKMSSKTEESPKSKNGTKRRIKKRKAVNKTYMDDDGFMVTEKVYEEVSTDASECDEPVKKDNKKPTATKSPAKGKKSPKKTSPGKKGQGGGGKQTNLMSFFTKKN